MNNSDCLEFGFKNWISEVDSDRNYLSFEHDINGIVWIQLTFFSYINVSHQLFDCFPLTTVRSDASFLAHVAKLISSCASYDFSSVFW